MTVRNHSIPLGWTLLILIPIAFFLYLFNFDRAAVVVFGGFALLDFLPVSYLHYSYWRCNKGEEYVFSPNEVTRIRNGQKEVFTSDDVKHVIVYMSARMDKGGIPMIGMEHYYYARLLLKCERELLLTCLVVPEIDQVVNQLKGVSIERKKRIPCLLGWK